MEVERKSSSVLLRAGRCDSGNRDLTDVDSHAEGLRVRQASLSCWPVQSIPPAELSTALKGKVLERGPVFGVCRLRANWCGGWGEAAAGKAAQAVQREES